MRPVERTAKKRPRPKQKGGGMALRIAGRLDVPKWVRDHASFRRWARSPEVSEKAQIAFYNATLWIDPDMEQFYVHNQVKAEVTAVLLPLVKAAGTGRYGTDGMLITNPEFELSTVPDGFYFSFESFRAGAIREVAGARNGCTEFEGVPEMILEVVSNSSETKDLVDLRDLYWRAGVREYWLIDARTEEVSFEILKTGDRGFVETKRLPGGWLRSELFHKAFRLVRSQDPIGRPVYTFEVK
jgi:Uma2 family endonuclease